MYYISILDFNHRKVVPKILDSSMFHKNRTFWYLHTSLHPNKKHLFFPNQQKAAKRIKRNDFVSQVLYVWQLSLKKSLLSFHLQNAAFRQSKTCTIYRTHSLNDFNFFQLFTKSTDIWRESLLQNLRNFHFQIANYGSNHSLWWLMENREAFFAQQNDFSNSENILKKYVIGIPSKNAMDVLVPPVYEVRAITTMVSITVLRQQLSQREWPNRRSVAILCEYRCMLILRKLIMSVRKSDQTKNRKFRFGLRIL